MSKGFSCTNSFCGKNGSFYIQLCIMTFIFQQQYICIHNCLACVLAGEEETEEEVPGEDNEGFEGELISDIST